MVSNNKLPMETRLSIDIIMVLLGVVVGGIVAIASLGLWLDYHANPAQSYLTTLSYGLQSMLPSYIRAYLLDQTKMMGLPLTGQSSAYWYMSRAGGVIGYILLWLSTVWGLVLSTKITKNLISAPIAYGLHEFLSILAIIFSILHAVVLLGDKYIQFNIFHLMIPFTAPYEPIWTGLGTISLYLIIALTGSFYIRKQIGQKIWRLFHYLGFAAYALVLGHGLMAGTDTPLPVLKGMYLVTGMVVLFLTYYRMFTLKPKRR